MQKNVNPFPRYCVKKALQGAFNAESPARSSTRPPTDLAQPAGGCGRGSSPQSNQAPLIASPHTPTTISHCLHHPRTHNKFPVASPNFHHCCFLAGYLDFRLLSLFCRGGARLHPISLNSRRMRPRSLGRACAFGWHCAVFACTRNVFEHVVWPGGRLRCPNLKYLREIHVLFNFVTPNWLFTGN